MSFRSDEALTESWVKSARDYLKWSSNRQPITQCSGTQGSCPASYLGTRPSCPTFTQCSCPGGWLACLAKVWEESGHSLETITQIQREQIPNILPTVFQFGPDLLFMLVDVRGFEPTNIQVEVLGCGVRLRIVQKDTLRSDFGEGITAARNLERLYEFPYPLSAQDMVSTVKDGTLFLSVPWVLPR